MPPPSRRALSGKMGRYEGLLRDERVRRWFKNLARGSPITCEVALRRLGRVCELLERSPREILDWAGEDPMGFQDSLEDLVSRLEEDPDGSLQLHNLKDGLLHRRECC